MVELCHFFAHHSGLATDTYHHLPYLAAHGALESDLMRQHDRCHTSSVSFCPSHATHIASEAYMCLAASGRAAVVTIGKPFVRGTVNSAHICSWLLELL